MKVLIVLVGLLGLSYAQECSPNQFTCDNGRCIPAAYVCDGDNDCGDGSDERDCPTTTTTPCSGFECPNGRCIPESWRCDGDNDCGDGSDERDCPSTTTTPCSGFQCPNGRCIPSSYVCDGDNDCGDYSDETDCANCPGYTCEETRRCIPQRAICDGNDDCGDGSDETEEACPCADGEVRCAKPPGSNVPGPCIPPEWVCDEDGIWDCPDGSDEANCTMPVKTRHARPLFHHKRTSRKGSLHNLIKLSEKEKENMVRQQRKAESLYAFLHYRPRKEKKMKF